MSYNGSGTYVPPAGQPVATGTVIQSATFNTLITDIGNTFNNVLPRDGQAPMQGQLKITDGTSSIPGIAFNSEASTGIFRPSNGVLALSVSGVEGMRINSAGRLMLGTTTDDGTNKLQVNGTAKITGATTLSSTLSVTGAVTAPSFNGALVGNVTGNVTGNVSGTAANITGIAAAANGGTGIASYAIGDILYANGAASLTKLPGNATTTRKFFAETGNGSVTNIVEWTALAAGDIPNLDWSKITTNKPTTRDGYGITDVYLKTEDDALLATKEATANKNTSNGYVGLSGGKIVFRNLGQTFTSFLQNSATAARTYAFQDRDGTIADLTDIGTKAAKGANSDITSLSGLTTALSVTQGGTGATSTNTALLNLAATKRAQFASAPEASITADSGDRSISNPSTGIGYGAGMRVRFAHTDDVTVGNYSDVIDLSTYADLTGGGYNSLYFNKQTQSILHKFGAAGATSWTTKTLAYLEGPTFVNDTFFKGTSTLANASAFIRVTDTATDFYASSSSGVSKSLNFHADGNAGSILSLNATTATVTGSATITSKLAVGASMTPDTRIGVLSNTDATNSGDGISFYGSSANKQASIISWNTGNFSGDLRFNVSQKASASTATTTEAMRLSSRGAALFGTTTDDGTSQVQVNGNTSTASLTVGKATAQAGGNGQVKLYRDTGALAWAMGVDGSAGGTNWILYDMVGSATRLAVAPDGTLTSYVTGSQRLQVTSSGVAVTGAASASNGLTVNGAATNILGGVAATLANAGFMQIGGAGGMNVVYDYNQIQARNNGAAAQLNLNANGGLVTIGSGGLSTSGDVWASGNVTAYSDERLKTNWRDVAIDFVEKLAAVKHGVYDRIDTKQTQVGLSAQSIQAFMPEAVVTSDEGTLSLNYGAVGAVSAVKLAKEVLSLRQEIAKAKKTIARLVKFLEGSKA